MKYKVELDFEYNKDMAFTLLVLAFSSLLTSYTLLTAKNYSLSGLLIVVGIGLAICVIILTTRFEKNYRELRKKLK